MVEGFYTIINIKRLLQTIKIYIERIKIHPTQSSLKTFFVKSFYLFHANSYTN